MKKLVLTLLICAAIFISIDGYAQEKVFENYWVEIAPFNYLTGCDGSEVILNLQGEVHRMIQTKMKKNGSVQHITNRNGHLTGIGQDSNKKYNWIVNRHRTWTFYPPSYPYSFFNNWRLRIIVQGDAPDLFWTITEKITIDKNGVTKVELFDASYECK